MSNEAFNTEFELRYAIRVLALQARFCRRVDLLIKAVSLLAGTAAFAAITNQHAQLALFIGFVLAAAQVIEFVARPGEHASNCRQAAKPYQQLLIQTHSQDVKQTRVELERVRAADDVDVFESLRNPAYNDIAAELGCEPQFMVKLGAAETLMGWLA